jgi:hypothetical protein
MRRMLNKIVATGKRGREDGTEPLALVKAVRQTPPSPMGHLEALLFPEQQVGLSDELKGCFLQPDQLRITRGWIADHPPEKRVLLAKNLVWALREAPAADACALLMAAFTDRPSAWNADLVSECLSAFDKKIFSLPTHMALYRKLHMVLHAEGQNRFTLPYITKLRIEDCMGMLFGRTDEEKQLSGAIVSRLICTAWGEAKPTLFEDLVRGAVGIFPGMRGNPLHWDICNSLIAAIPDLRAPFIGYMSAFLGPEVAHIGLLDREISGRTIADNAQRFRKLLEITARHFVFDLRYAFPIGKESHKPMRLAFRIFIAVLGPDKSAQWFADYLATNPPSDQVGMTKKVRGWINAAETAEEARLLAHILIVETEKRHTLAAVRNRKPITPENMVQMVAQDCFPSPGELALPAACAIAFALVEHVMARAPQLLRIPPSQSGVIENSWVVQDIFEWIKIAVAVDAQTDPSVSANRGLCHLLSLLTTKGVAMLPQTLTELRRLVLHKVAQSGASDLPESFSLALRFLKPCGGGVRLFNGVNALDSLLNLGGTTPDQQLAFLTRAENNRMLKWLLGPWLHVQLIAYLRTTPPPDRPTSLSTHLATFFGTLPIAAVPRDAWPIVTMVALLTTDEDGLTAWKAFNNTPVNELEALYRGLPQSSIVAVEFRTFLSRLIFSTMSINLEAIQGDQFRCPVENLPDGPWRSENIEKLLVLFEEAYSDIQDGAMFVPDLCRHLQLARAALEKADALTPDLLKSIRDAAIENHRCFVNATVSQLSKQELTDENMAVLDRWKTAMARQATPLGQEGQKWVTATISRVETGLVEGYQALMAELDSAPGDLGAFRTFAEPWLMRLDTLYQQLYVRTGLLRMVQYTQTRTPYRGAPSAENDKAKFEAWYQDVEDRMKYVVYRLSASQIPDDGQRLVKQREVLSALAIQGRACATGWTDALRTHTATGDPVKLETFKRQFWSWVHQYLENMIENPVLTQWTYFRFMALIKADLGRREAQLQRLQAGAEKRMLELTYAYLRNQAEIIEFNLKQPAHMRPFLRNILGPWIGIPPEDDDAVVYRARPNHGDPDADQIYTQISAEVYRSFITVQTSGLLSTLIDAMTRPSAPFTTEGVADVLKVAYDENTFGYDPVQILGILRNTGTGRGFVSFPKATVEQAHDLLRLYERLFGKAKTPSPMEVC